jgi:hypothetical protein
MIKANSRNAGLAPWYNSAVTATGVNSLMASGPVAGLAAGDLVWNFVLHCDGAGNVILDLTDRVPGSIQYGYPGNWLIATEADLGDLTIHQIPEPATIALLGLGGLFLVRRRR